MIKREELESLRGSLMQEVIEPLHTIKRAAEEVRSNIELAALELSEVDKSEQIPTEKQLQKLSLVLYEAKMTIIEMPKDIERYICSLGMTAELLRVKDNYKNVKTYLYKIDLILSDTTEYISFYIMRESQKCLPQAEVSINEVPEENIIDLKFLLYLTVKVLEQFEEVMKLQICALIELLKVFATLAEQEGKAAHERALILAIHKQDEIEMRDGQISQKLDIYRELSRHIET